MNISRIIDWVRQPTTIAGLAAIAGTASALLMDQLRWPQAVPVLVGAATSMLLPDNAAAPGVARALAQDATVLLGMASGGKGGEAKPQCSKR